MEPTKENDIKQLNSFLRGELSAVETYDQVIAKIDNPAIVNQLQLLQESHLNRSIVLTQKIKSLGGEPAESSGVWGSFAQAVEGAAGVFGASSAITVLEEGEDHGKDQYESNLENLTASQQVFIRDVIYPEQQKSHDILSVLEDQV